VEFLEKDDEIRVSGKPINRYIQACNHCLSNHSRAKIRGLGKRTDKVLDIKDVFSEISNVEIVEMNTIEDDGVSGLELVLETKEGDENDE